MKSIIGESNMVSFYSFIYLKNRPCAVPLECVGGSKSRIINKFYSNILNFIYNLHFSILCNFQSDYMNMVLVIQ